MTRARVRARRLGRESSRDDDGRARARVPRGVDVDDDDDDAARSETDDLIAGVVAGAACTLAGHPFDTVKVFLQENAAKGARAHTTASATREIYARRGVRGLYAGVAAPLIGASLETGAIRVLSSYSRTNSLGGHGRKRRFRVSFGRVGGVGGDRGGGDVRVLDAVRIGQVSSAGGTGGRTRRRRGATNRRRARFAVSSEGSRTRWCGRFPRERCTSRLTKCYRPFSLARDVRRMSRARRLKIRTFRCALSCRFSSSRLVSFRPFHARPSRTDRVLFHSPRRFISRSPRRGFVRRRRRRRHLARRHSARQRQNRPPVRTSRRSSRPPTARPHPPSHHRAWIQRPLPRRVPRDRPRVPRQRRPVALVGIIKSRALVAPPSLLLSDLLRIDLRRTDS